MNTPFQLPDAHNFKSWELPGTTAINAKSMNTISGLAAWSSAPLTSNKVGKESGYYLVFTFVFSFSENQQRSH